MNKKIEVLELFSGLASWSKPFKDNGYKTVTLDYNCNFKPDICMDILDWDFHNADIKPDIIFASPDCTYFSNARARWGYPEDKIAWTISLWEKTFEIIKYFEPLYYLIENPVGKAQKYFKPTGKINYCMYDYKINDIYVPKPTVIYSNIPFSYRTCNKEHSHGKNKAGLSALVRNKSKRAKIPEGLTNEIYNVIMKNIDDTSVLGVTVNEIF